MKKKHQCKLRNSQLKILDEIVRICDEKNLTYFLDYGTLIGAVRHKGYIPWDDDLDIGMLRKDFDSFLEIAPTLLKKDFILCCYKTEKNHWHTFAKVRLKDTEMLEEGNQHLDMNKGIWVDIFPYDNINKPNSFGHKFRKKVFDVLTTIIALNLNIDYYHNAKKARIIKMVSKIFDVEFLYRLREVISKLNKDDNTEYVCSFDEPSEKCCKGVLRNRIIPCKKLKFENKEYNVPNDYDYRLKIHYGDYMTIPPKEKQINHNPILILFEDGEIVRFK